MGIFPLPVLIDYANNLVFLWHGLIDYMIVNDKYWIRY